MKHQRLLDKLTVLLLVVSDDEYLRGKVHQLCTAIQRSESGFLQKLNLLILRKRAKYGWCAPTAELDDYLGARSQSEQIANEVYELL